MKFIDAISPFFCCSTEVALREFFIEGDVHQRRVATSFFDTWWVATCARWNSNCP